MSNLKHYRLSPVSCSLVQQLVCDGTHVLLDIWNVDQQALMHMNAALTGHSCSRVICCVHTCKIRLVSTTFMCTTVFPLMQNSNTIFCDTAWKKPRLWKTGKGGSCKKDGRKDQFKLIKKIRKKEVHLKACNEDPNVVRYQDLTAWKVLASLQKEHKN